MMMKTSAVLLLLATTAAAGDVCCQAMPSCPWEFREAKDGECTELHRAFGLCKKETRCCRTIECIRELPTRPPVCCMAMPVCTGLYKNVDFGECTKLDFAQGTCKTESLCCKTVHCKKVEPVFCCQAHPVCPSGTAEDDKCTELDLAAGRCVEESVCCKTVRCRVTTH